MKSVYCFGNGKADGSAKDKNLLGGKGANLAEMTRLGIPVPPGFTITTEVCTHYMKHQSYPDGIENEVNTAIEFVENIMDQKFGDMDNPLLMSVRSGARTSMPGMMETVLNLGLTSKTIPGLIDKSGNERFVYDAYRRLIMMYSDVVMEKAGGAEPKEGEGIREQLEEIMEDMKKNRGVSLDTDLTASDLKELSELFKNRVKETLGKEFPDDHYEQLWGGISSVFSSWNGKRAKNYRRIENIPDVWGTAVNVQVMVFGNMGENCATGVAFTRNPATGENLFYGEWLKDAQGEDVVAGTRTPNPLTNSTKEDGSALVSLEDDMPEIYLELDGIQKRLENHYRDMQDIEFTVQDGRLWMLQTRNGKRNGMAAIRMAVEMLNEKLISKEEAILRVRPEQLDEIMHPMIDPASEKSAELLAKGLPAGPGGGTGQIVFTADVAEQWKSDGKKVILVRNETSPEDVHGMHAAEAILTAKGGMTSHAALVARGWGKCCIVGCSALEINARNKTLTINGQVFNEGDIISLNGTSGKVYNGALSLIDPDLDSNTYFTSLMKIADSVRKLNVRTNADSPADAAQARSFGAEGIGLCRTEHMFFDPARIMAMREMIVAENEEARRTAIMKLLPYQREDFYGILKAMAPFPVTIRLLDPPLHEFLPQNDGQITELASELKIEKDSLKKRIDSLHELNPMLGHRGCRLGVAYPEITEMQARAVFEATVKLIKEGEKPFPEVMVPLVGSVTELAHQKKLIIKIANDVQAESGIKFDYLVGTMIELPRACFTADEIAEEAEFFSFGTNDLTQTTFGFSRDDIGGFLPQYLQDKILEGDPFQSIDQKGVGSAVKMGVDKGRLTKHDLKIGVCGEHGGDPNSIDFFHRIGLNYVSCSPFRVPIARLSAAQATLNN
ncbi:MAG: pyruvate, phosphate dikinase [Candidatus Marinimicrobia bacterium]|nr:pyruvate, phosphate dikinase [Candidatus Neomarinimicrobiota bacterium]MBL7022983.1 pyruvate, phosphate dikinase [Candidatus Neomarinimicrobiota bacterium]MBL7109531.1 pyruvate, phosphate dikinase [Candidatus Neomarinimicrobiota bacterium]